MENLPDDPAGELFDYYHNDEWLIVTDDLLYISPNSKLTREAKLELVEFWIDIDPPDITHVEWLLKVEKDAMVGKKLKYLKINHAKITKSIRGILESDS